MSKSGTGMDHEVCAAIPSTSRVSGPRRSRRYRPKTIAFTSKKAASLFYGRPTCVIALGRQPPMSGFPDVFVLSSPSGAASGSLDVAAVARTRRMDFGACRKRNPPTSTSHEIVLAPAGYASLTRSTQCRYFSNIVSNAPSRPAKTKCRRGKVRLPFCHIHFRPRFEPDRSRSTLTACPGPITARRRTSSNQVAEAAGYFKTGAIIMRRISASLRRRRPCPYRACRGEPRRGCFPRHPLARYRLLPGLGLRLSDPSVARELHRHDPSAADLRSGSGGQGRDAAPPSLRVLKTVRSAEGWARVPRHRARLRLRFWKV